MVVGAAATQSGGGDLRGPDDDLVLPVSQHAASQWNSLPAARLHALRCLLTGCHCTAYSVAAAAALPTHWLLLHCQVADYLVAAAALLALTAAD